MELRKNGSLLIITQVVDSQDAALGFFHQWIEEFSLHFSRVQVLCLRKGCANLPKNVDVLSLGKERGAGRIHYIKTLFAYVVGKRDEYDAVFVHMNPVYIVLCGLVWRMMGKRVVLWYMHRSKTLNLKIAQFFANSIVTATKESYPLHTKKLIVTGHGIDTDRRNVTKVDTEANKFINISTIGRITPIKQPHLFIEGVAKIRSNKPLLFTIVGGPVTPEDQEYMSKLGTMVKDLGLADATTFTGPVPHEDVWRYLSRTDICINLSKTGSLDKTILEAFALGIPVISSNPAIAPLVTRDFPEAYLQEDEAAALSKRIEMFLGAPEITKKKTLLIQRRVLAEHSLHLTVAKISQILYV